MSMYGLHAGISFVHFRTDQASDNESAPLIALTGDRDDCL